MTVFYFAKILAYLTVASCLIPFYFTIKYTLIRGLTFINPLFLYLLLTFVIELTAIFLSLNEISNLWLYQIQSLLEFLIFLILIFQFIPHKKIKYLAVFMFIMFLSILVLEISFVNAFYNINPYLRKFEAISLVFLSVIGFLHLIRNAGTDPITSVPFFWFLVAVLLYFSGNLFLFLFSEFLAKKSLIFFGAIYSIHSILNIIFNLLLTVHIVKKYKWN